jgi:SAM-dependent methyltransferase
MTGFPARLNGMAETIRPWVAQWQVNSALDAGCGGGALLLTLDNLGVEVAGLDLSTGMLLLAEANAKTFDRHFELAEISFESAGEKWPAKFDAVFSIGNSLVGAQDDLEMTAWLTGLHDALRHGGRLLLQILNLTPFLHGAKRVIARRTTDAGDYVRIVTPTEDYLTFAVLFLAKDGTTEVEFARWGAWEKARMMGCLQAAGFEVDGVYGSLKQAPFDEGVSTDLVIAAHSGRESAG